jgi:hypothetical protein
MACPSCGGNSRQLIAPGFFRCTSRVMTRSSGPGLSDPRLGPSVIETARECGAEYQEGVQTTGLECSCGTFAVGRCTECSQPKCGAHSGLYRGGKRLCGTCWRKADEAQATIAKEQAAEAEKRRLEKREAWRQRVLSDLAGTEPVERLLRVVGRFCERDSGRGQANAAIEELLGSPTWTLAQVKEWFCRHVTGSPLDEIKTVKKTFFGGEKYPKVAAWTFREASNTKYRFYDIDLFLDIAIADDGRVFYHSNKSKCWWPLEARGDDHLNFSHYGLLLVFEASGLQPVEAPPVGVISSADGNDGTRRLPRNA